MKSSAESFKITPLDFKSSGLGREEWKTLKQLNTPKKIQDFINAMPFNFEKGAETYMSAGRSLRAGKAHCFEGALVAAAALWIAGERPLLLDLNADPKEDDDHVVVVFKREGFLGAISKTNHSVLRYREPVYRDVRELAMSYFHEYFLEDGIKTMRSFSKLFDLSKFRSQDPQSPLNWISGEEELIDMINKIEESPHVKILNRSQRAQLRKADKVEIASIDITEYKTPEWYYNKY